MQDHLSGKKSGSLYRSDQRYTYKITSRSNKQVFMKEFLSRDSNCR